MLLRTGAKAHWSGGLVGSMKQSLNRLIAAIKAFLSRYDTIQAKLKEMEAEQAEAVKLIEDTILELEKRGE
mgnify:CR=1 FL=1